MAPVLKYWKDSSDRNWRFRKYVRLQKYYQGIVRRFKNKTVGFGDYNSATGGCIRARKGPIKHMKHFLRRNGINLIDVDEYRTSKLCYRCHSILGNYYPKPNEQKRRKITHYDSEYMGKWPETIEKVVVNKQTNASKIISYEVCFKEVDKVPFAKFKCCPNVNCNDIKNPRIIHRDLNASHNILNKLKRMLNNEDELPAFKR